MTEPRYVKIYCQSASLREQAQVPMGREWTNRNKRSLGLTLAEKVDGRWRCRCCGKPVRVVA